ncbi:MAG: TatD family hydrolase [Bacteroidetes bacterium]|nr:TatD family hydrolase [Bacteroidota bacterium]
MLINVHTHKVTNGKCIVNLYRDFEKMEEHHFYSLGIHPWYIDANDEVQLDRLKYFSVKENVIAIGETGLDKACTTDFELQQERFIAQIHLANELKKPLIIHCVRAWSEIFQLLTTENISVPVIFHGFNKSIELARQVIEQGFYLSFGKALQNNSIAEVLKDIPLEKCFFETDVIDIPIDEIYQLATNALATDINLLSLQIQKNAETVFGTSFLI